MSILIKGMEMPIKGSYTVTIHSDGRVTVTPTRPLKHGFVVGKAVEIPKHGRLIDADRLIKRYKAEKFTGYEEIIQDILDEPIVEAISKADYENRLKADMVAMLVELQKEIEELEPLCNECDYAIDDCTSKAKVNNVIQEKINELKGDFK